MTSRNLAEQKARDALAFDPLPDSRWVSVHPDSGITVAVRYSEPLSHLLRSIPSARWDHDNRRWTFPYSSAESIRRALPEIERLAAAASGRAEEETLRRDAARAEAERRRQSEDMEAAKRRAAVRPRALRQEFLSAADAPMFHLAIESIADDLAQKGRMHGFRPRAWVAQIMGMDGRGNPVRAYLAGNKDYSSSNSVGSRGIFLNYQLQQGLIYEISSPQSWRHTDRYFIRIVAGQIVRLTRQEVEECLAK